MDHYLLVFSSEQAWPRTYFTENATAQVFTLYGAVWMSVSALEYHKHQSKYDFQLKTLKPVEILQKLSGMESLIWTAQLFDPRYGMCWDGSIVNSQTFCDSFIATYAIM